MKEGVQKWLVFSVALSLLPLLISLILYWLQDEPFNLFRLISNGELLIIGCTLSAATIGELNSAVAKRNDLRLIAPLGGLVLSTLLCAFVFAAIAALGNNGPTQIIEEIFSSGPPASASEAISLYEDAEDALSVNQTKLGWLSVSLFALSASISWYTISLIGD